MARTSLFVLALCGLATSFIGCDASKEELDKTKTQLAAMTTERDTLKTQLAAAQGATTAAQAQVADLTAKLASTTATANAEEKKLEKVQGKLEAGGAARAPGAAVTAKEEKKIEAVKKAEVKAGTGAAAMHE